LHFCANIMQVLNHAARPRRLPALPALATRGLAFGALTELSGARRNNWDVWIVCLSHSSLHFSLPRSQFNVAGVPGFEPGLSVLETDVLTVDTIHLSYDAGTGRPGYTEKTPRLRVALSPVSKFISSLCDLCACGNGDRTC